MFTGIIQNTAVLENREDKPQFARLAFKFPAVMLEKLEPGASISCDGVCLTVVQTGDSLCYFDVMEESLRKTTLGSLAVGDRINIERAARFGDEIGGHSISGHVDTTAEVAAISQTETNYVIRFGVEGTWLKYIFSKGYIALNGASLTVVDCDSQGFSVYFIPETLRKTTFREKLVGSRINLEIDRMTQAVVDTTERYLEQRKL